MADNTVQFVHKLEGLDVTLRVTIDVDSDEDVVDSSTVEFFDSAGNKVMDPELVEAAMAHLKQLDNMDLTTSPTAR